MLAFASFQSYFFVQTGYELKAAFLWTENKAIEWTTF